ncbi:hypothetical protein ACFO1B_44850 [Dactylosporangium siamense]|uniref:Uncharacterized protein n=1 Tax=Dactylosporangium siamense TaxID=685454 RepID=A0A919PXX7_9ACTN|nr:hypothetical protein [Dactylosporangium siamense]GIG51291.1 hypothetical protein Dsi01nite_093320 [Dactylosporangium siamense]
MEALDVLAAFGATGRVGPLPSQTFVTDDGPEPVLHLAGTWAHEHDRIPAAAVNAAFPDDFPPERAH